MTGDAAPRSTRLTTQGVERTSALDARTSTPALSSQALAIMLVTLSVGTFFATGTGTVLSPFLLSIAGDLGTDLAAIANLVALMSITWGLASLIAGAASDRIGRKPVLTFGLLGLGTALFGVASAGSYPQIALCQLLAGLGGGSYMGTVFAAASDRVPPGQRGRALGWIITGQSLSLVIGVPLITFIGSFGGWRGAVAFQALAALVSGAAVWLAVPGAPPQRVRSTSAGRASLHALSPRILALLLAGTMERACFSGLAVYLATYLITTYGVPLQELALGLALVALGNLVGNLAGGYLTDRLPARPLLFAATSTVTGLLALPTLLWQPGLGITLALGFAYSFANAMGRPALIAAQSTVPESVRGLVLGLNITCASLGWISATALGGLLVTQYGFGALGALTAATGLLGAALGAVSWLGKRAEG